MSNLFKKPYVLEQGPLITRKQADSYAMERGVEGLIIGVAAGLVIGAAITVLTTPKSGRETRLEIKNAGASAMNGMKETTTVAAGKVKNAASGITSKIKDKFTEIREAAYEDDIVVCECCCDLSGYDDFDPEDAAEVIAEEVKEAVKGEIKDVIAEKKSGDSEKEVDSAAAEEKN